MLECPACGHKWNDYCGETASFNENGEMIDYDCYYRCPNCEKHIDMNKRVIVDYNSIKHLKITNNG